MWTPRHWVRLHNDDCRTVCETETVPSSSVWSASFHNVRVYSLCGGYILLSMRSGFLLDRQSRADIIRICMYCDWKSRRLQSVQDSPFKISV